MAEYFDADYGTIQLSVALYLAFNAALQLIVGPLSDRFGRRPVILWGNLIFLAVTLGCLFASTVETFLFFRMAQAVIVTGMVLSRAVVRDMVSDDQAASKIAYVTMGMAIVPMISPAIGGILDSLWGWKANFWMLFIMGALTAWVCWKDLGETHRPKPNASLVRQFTDYPELLKSPRFWGYALTSAFTSGAFFAYLGGAPFVGDKLYHMAPHTLGIFFGAPAIGYLCGNFISGRFSVRVGINRMVTVGALVNMVGVGISLSLFLAGLGSEYVFFGFMTCVGVGNGMVIPNATAGALSVRPHLAGTASGLSGAIMIGGGAALSALSGALLTHETGAFPLLWIMFLTSAAGLASIIMVVRRERTVFASDESNSSEQRLQSR